MKLHRQFSHAVLTGLLTFASAFLLMGCPKPVVITVPDVLGQTSTEAEALLTDAGLLIGTIMEASSDDAPVGTIISQQPAAGEQVARDTRIDVFVSSGPLQVLIPNVKGLPIAWAEITINNARLAVGNITFDYSDLYPEGVVTSQSPLPGTSTNANTPIDLLVSLGSETGEELGELICTVILTGDLEVPPVTTDASGVASFYWYEEDDLVRMILHHAVENVTVAHFHTGAPGENGPPVITLDTSTNPIEHELTVAEYDGLMIDSHYINVHSTEFPPGEIRGDLDCTPINAGGEGEGEGEEIQLPDFTGSELSDVETILDDLGLHLGDVSEEYSDTILEGRVISQTPPAGSEVEPGTAIALVMSLGPQPIPTTALIEGAVVNDSGEFISGVTITVYEDGDLIAQTQSEAGGQYTLEVGASENLLSIIAAWDALNDGVKSFDPETYLAYAPSAKQLTPIPGLEYELNFVLYQEANLMNQQLEFELESGLTRFHTPDQSIMLSNVPIELGIVGGSGVAFSPTFNPDAFPGDFSSREEGLESMLISGGFASINLLQEGPDGTLLPISQLLDENGEPVFITMRFRIDRADWHVIQDDVHYQDLPGYVERPDRINAPLYFYDEALGDWVLSDTFGWLEDQFGPIPPESLPAIQSGAYDYDIYMVGEVSHFTWYNLDYPGRDACVTGRIIDQDGEPVAGATVTIRSMEGGTTSFFSNIITRTTDHDGRFRARIPRSEVNPGDDWNNNNQVDTFAFYFTVEKKDLCGIALFDNNGSGWFAPDYPEEEGCQELGNFETILKEAKLKTFRITFIDSVTGDPLHVPVGSMSDFQYTMHRLYDPRVPIGSRAWKCVCDADPEDPCIIASSTLENGMSLVRIPILDDEDDEISRLFGSFVYRKLRPDLGFGAYEFATLQFAHDPAVGSQTYEVEVERRGPPVVEILSPLSGDVFLYDDMVTFEATGEDVMENSIDPLNMFQWYGQNRSGLLAQTRTFTAPAWQTLGVGSNRGLVVDGIDFYGWLGSDEVNGITVEAVSIEIEEPLFTLVATGNSLALNAIVTGANNTNVLWSSSNITTASINNAGVLTGNTPGIVTITARSAVDTTKTDTIEITIEDLVPLFSIIPNSGTTEDTFTYDANASVGTIAAYDWNFGDGNLGGGILTTHNYPQAGTYPVTLTITSISGAQRTSAAFNLVVVEPEENQPPVADFSASPQSGNPPLEVMFDGSASTDTDGTIESYHWDFGDGNTESGILTSHVYTEPGTYTITLTVEDDEGDTGMVTQQVRVNAAPVADFSHTLTPVTGEAPLDVSVNAADSFDPDGQIVLYAWDFGDDTTVSGSDLVSTSHIYEFPGAYIISLTVTDNDGLSDSVSELVEAGGLLANLSAAILADEPYLTYRFDASESFSYPHDIVGYQWEIIGSQFVFAEKSTIYESNEITFDFQFYAADSYQVRLTTEDSMGNTDTTSTHLGIYAPNSVINNIQKVNISPEHEFYWGVSLPSISADGRHVAFNSMRELIASKAQSDDQDRAFIHDMETGNMIMVPALQNQYDIYALKLSGDGNKLVFLTGNQIYVYDILEQVFYHASSNAEGDPANVSSFSPDISHDGRYVAFQSNASNLVEEVSGTNVYVKDIETGAVDFIGPSHWDGYPRISFDGRLVAFVVNLDQYFDEMDGRQLIVFDRDTREANIASADEVNQLIDDVPPELFDFAHGSYHIGMTSKADNLRTESDNPFDVFLKELSEGTLLQISSEIMAECGEDTEWRLPIGAGKSAFSANGDVVVYLSQGGIDNCGEAWWSSLDYLDIVLHDYVAGKTAHIKELFVSEDPEWGFPQSFSDLAISADGRYVVFQTGTNFQSDRNIYRVENPFWEDN